MPPRTKRPKKPRRIPGLELRLEVTAWVDGEKVDVPPVTSTWSEAFATDWHENHLELGVRTMMRSLLWRVRKAKGYEL